MSLAPTPVRPSVRRSHVFGFPFCQRLWYLTKRRDDIAVADMEVGRGGRHGGGQGDQHGGRHGGGQGDRHGGRLGGEQAYPACASSELCEFISVWKHQVLQMFQMFLRSIVDGRRLASAAVRIYFCPRLDWVYFGDEKYNHFYFGHRHATTSFIGKILQNLNGFKYHQSWQDEQSAH